MTDPATGGGTGRTDHVRRQNEGDDGYAVMLAELESILAELEGADVDVDLLAQRVARAAELVEACRDRIERAQLEVERVLATIQPTAEPPSPPTQAAEPE